MTQTLDHGEAALEEDDAVLGHPPVRDFVHRELSPA